MGNTKKYLDLEGLGTYHDELVQRLTDLEYDPNRIFANKVELFSLQKWGMDKYGRIVGLKEGLIVSVGNEIWQLENPTTFNSVLRAIMDVNAKAAMTPSQLGWKVLGSTVDFDISDHVLQLTK